MQEPTDVEAAGIKEAFGKLEGQLWGIAEAINKQSAVELLRSRYPSFDDKTISRLYEELKGGMYEARNRVLSPIGDIKRRIQEDEQRQKLSPEEQASCAIL